MHLFSHLLRCLSLFFSSTHITIFSHNRSIFLRPFLLLVIAVFSVTFLLFSYALLLKQVRSCLFNRIGFLFANLSTGYGFLGFPRSATEWKAQHASIFHLSSFSIQPSQQLISIFFCPNTPLNCEVEVGASRRRPSSFAWSRTDQTVMKT